MVRIQSPGLIQAAIFDSKIQAPMLVSATDFSEQMRLFRKLRKHTIPGRGYCLPSAGHCHADVALFRLGNGSAVKGDNDPFRSAKIRGLLVRNIIGEYDKHAIGVGTWDIP